MHILALHWVPFSVSLCLSDGPCWGTLGKLGGDTSVGLDYTDCFDSGTAAICCTAAARLPSLTSTLYLGSGVRRHTLSWCASVLLAGYHSSLPDAALPEPRPSASNFDLHSSTVPHPPKTNMAVCWNPNSGLQYVLTRSEAKKEQL